MEEKVKMVESLIENAKEYGRSSIELAKLKLLRRTTDVISTLIPQSFILTLIASFMLFVSLGASLWLGEILGNSYYGFFVVAGFYLVVGVSIHLFFRKRLKRLIGDRFVKQMLNND